MFFANAARILAWLLFLSSVYAVGFGISVASGWLGPSGRDLWARYWPNSATGEVIDKGVMWLVVGVALGTLAEAALLLRRKSDAAKLEGSKAP